MTMDEIKAGMQVKRRDSFSTLYGVVLGIEVRGKQVHVQWQRAVSNATGSQMARYKPAKAWMKPDRLSVAS